MSKVNIPEWLGKYLEDSGFEQASYVFDLTGVTLDKLPAEFIGIAEGNNGDGLAVAKKNDEVVYQWSEKEISVFAMNKVEFISAIRREEAWEELAENMPAAHSYWLGIVLKTKHNGQSLTLGFPHLQRASAMVIRGRVEKEEMLNDALDRELKTNMEIEDYQVLDLIDDGGVVDGDSDEPMFTVTVEVEYFDPLDKIKDPQIGWVGEEEVLVN